ncbi:MAG: DNA-directed RNA polymerase subunit L [Candidatus Woesearchaeota archaeon]
MVEVRILEDKKTRLVVELEGADHTVCNSIKQELWNDPHVKISGYNLKHPLVGIPTMTIETDSTEAPKKALTEAIKRLKKVNESFKEKISKELK